MKSYSLLEIPDLPIRAFLRGPDGSIKPQGKGDAPATPDYAGAAQATAAGNLAAAKQATQANRVNQITPWGSSTWSNNPTFDQAGYDAAMKNYQQQLAAYNNQQSSPSAGSWQYNNNAGAEIWVPGSPGGAMMGNAPVAPDRNNFMGGDNWQQTITLSPSQQALFDQQNQLQQGLFSAQDAALGRVNQTMGQGFDASTLPSAGSVYDPTLATNNATDLIMQRLNPQLDRQQDALRAQLANQGITQGSQAYNTALTQFGQTRNDAQNQAALAGINLGMQQQGLQYNQQTQNRQQALALASYLRSLPLNELNALRTGNQVSMPQFPGYAQQATTGGPDLLGATQNTYNAQLGASNAQAASSSNTLGGLFGIGGALLQGAGAAGGFGALFSDRRLKRDIRRVGVGAHGLPVYSYRYVWGGPVQLGYMADEVERIAPHAVHEVAGFKTVNYGVI